MAVSVSEIGWSWRVLCLSQKRVNPPPNTPFFLRTPMPIRFTPTRWSSCVVPRALDPKSTEDQNSTTSSSQDEDLAYVGKLVAGSFVGGGVIKYGSALFPEITSPNLALALAIILTSVLVAVFLLIKESCPKL